MKETKRMAAKDVRCSLRIGTKISQAGCLAANTSALIGIPHYGASALTNVRDQRNALLPLHARALDSSRTKGIGGTRAGTTTFAAKILWIR